MCQKIVSYDKAPMVVEYPSLPPFHCPSTEEENVPYIYRENMHYSKCKDI